MKVTGYAYPWDVLGDDAFVERVQDLGIDEVAVALAYHSARAATPWSAERTSVIARTAALYRPVRAQPWGELVPAVPEWVSQSDSGGDAVRRLNGAGIPAAAWIVLTHNSQLGTQFPQYAVRNSFGESYPWALCPAQPAVREFAATLTAESVAGLDLASVILEACGPLGGVHQHQHEKTDGVWAPAAARLLSICCCDACAENWTGFDAEEVRETLCAEVQRIIATADLSVTEDRLPAKLSDVLLAGRQQSTDALRAAVLAVLEPGTRIVLHGALDPWVTGALPGLTPTAADDAATVVLQNWAPGQGSVDAVKAARQALPEQVAIGSYITAVAASPVPDIESYVTELAEAGAAELHLYHLGLAGPARWSDLHAATAAAHSAP
ncbi:hypothetical protein [Amycolatopsis benzoatilytica]|uniref:hypothetical protein n=1 Tax=Amycolatopsis benzoatilytica TaxID=346045 RepID=UPI0003675A92|nr:hypothetical protein [Amycolatopsis benzoatilytica]